MIEKNPLELYEQELENKKIILDNLNKNLEELNIEKSKMNKYEFAERYSQEEARINEYISRTNLEISRLEKIIDAYHNIEELNEKLNQLETIIPRDNQEQEELNIEKRKIEELKNRSMNDLPEEIKDLFLTENLDSADQKEKPIEDSSIKNNKEKGIDDYRKEMEKNEQEINHLKEEIEKLISLKDSIPSKEYEQDLLMLNRYNKREKGKLLRNRQIVTAYELIENNQERISYLNSLIARDEQDAKQIKEEIDALTSGIEKNKSFIPKNLYQNLSVIEHKEESPEKIESSSFEESEKIRIISEKEKSKIKGIDDYRKEMEENEQEIKHLEEEIEKLISLKSSLPSKEYEQELLSLNRHKKRERGKLLRNRQIVTSYELIESNKERISYLNSLIARDEQDEKQIKEEIDDLTSGIEKNKRFIPQTLYQRLTAIESIEAQNLESRLSEDSLDSPTNESLSDNSIQEELIQKSQTEEQVIPDNLEETPSEDKKEKAIDKQPISETSGINYVPLTPDTPTIQSEEETDYLDDEATKEELHEDYEEHANRDKGRVINRDPSARDESPKSTLEKITQMASKPKNKSEYSEDAEKTNTYKIEVETKNKPNTYTEASHSPESKTTDFGTPKNTNTDSTEGKTNEQTPKTNPQPALRTPRVETIDLDDHNNEAEEVTNKRKSKKNILKRIVIGISALATALVLLSAGINSFKKSKSTPTPTPNTNTESLNDTGIEVPEEDIIEIFEAPNQTYSIVDSNESIEELESQVSKESEILDKIVTEYENQTEFEIPKNIEQKVEPVQTFPTPNQTTSVEPETLITLEDLITPENNTDFSNTIEVIDSDALENAFMNSGIIEKKAEDEYSAAQGNWEGVKDENIQYWIDNPLRFTEDEKTGAYLMEQQDENGNWVGMGWTDAQTAYQYLHNLESYENQTGKGRH